MKSLELYVTQNTSKIDRPDSSQKVSIQVPSGIGSAVSKKARGGGGGFG